MDKNIDDTPGQNEVMKLSIMMPPSGNIMRGLSPRFFDMKCLGQGGQAEVYFGRDRQRPELDENGDPKPNSGVPVIIRVPLTDYPDRGRPHRTNYIGARFGHYPGVVSVLEQGSFTPLHEDGSPQLLERGSFDGSRPYEGKPIKMLYEIIPYSRGESLWSILRKSIIEGKKKKIPVVIAVAIIYKILKTIELLHGSRTIIDNKDEKALIHGDINSQNIMLDPDVGPLLIDFSNAVPLEYPGGNPAESSEAGEEPWRYRAPERWQAYTDFKTRSDDLYGAGVVLFEMLTAGKNPYGETSSQASLTLSEGKGPMMANVDYVLDGIVAKAVALDPKDRYRNAREFRLALESYLKKHKLDMNDIDATLIAFSRMPEIFQSTVLEKRTPFAIQLWTHKALSKAQTGLRHTLRGENKVARIGAIALAPFLLAGAVSGIGKLKEIDEKQKIEEARKETLRLRQAEVWNQIAGTCAQVTPADRLFFDSHPVLKERPNITLMKSNTFAFEALDVDECETLKRLFGVDSSGRLQNSAIARFQIGYGRTLGHVQEVYFSGLAPLGDYEIKLLRRLPELRTVVTSEGKSLNDEELKKFLENKAAK